MQYYTTRTSCKSLLIEFYIVQKLIGFSDIFYQINEKKVNISKTYQHGLWNGEL